MKEVVLSKPFDSEEDYFLFEEKSELKHEYINSTLFEISGASKYHNRIERRFANLIEQFLDKNLYEVYGEGFKVKTPDGNFFYPDITVSLPESERYYTNKPVLIVEVLSDSTRAFDLSDKFIQYRKCETLEYYLCIEPEKKVIYFFQRVDNNEWMVEEAYTDDEAVISLPKLNISLAVKDIYNS